MNRPSTSTLPSWIHLSLSALLALSLCFTLGCDGDESASCDYNGQTYSEGESFPSTDGCNTCGCESGGQIACTMMACAPITCMPGDCPNMSQAPNYLCDDGVTTAGPTPCELQDDGTCGSTMVECPEDPEE